MSVTNNIGNNLDKNFENHNYLPQKLENEDFDLSLFNYIKNFNFSVEDENGIMRVVPIVYLTQELWAERKMNWKSMRSEQGEEITRPFITLLRNKVSKGTSPAKLTIPKKKKFTFLKVPKFDGTLKGYDLYKIPQPVYVDYTYELAFVTHYVQDANRFYQYIFRDAYSDGQGYLSINGYDIASKISGDPSEENDTDDITSEKIYRIKFPITVFGKLIDPSQFEKVNTITKISIKITEKQN